MLLVTVCFDSFPWNFKKRLHFCIKYTSFFLLHHFVVMHVALCFFSSLFFVAAIYFFSLCCCVWYVVRERINCKTIQFIQKCFIFLCALYDDVDDNKTVAKRINSDDNTHIQGKKKKTHSIQLSWWHCYAFLPSFSIFSAFHFVVYYLFSLSPFVFVCEKKHIVFLYDIAIADTKNAMLELHLHSSTRSKCNHCVQFWLDAATSASPNASPNVSVSAEQKKKLNIQINCRRSFKIDLHNSFLSFFLSPVTSNECNVSECTLARTNSACAWTWEISISHPFNTLFIHALCIPPHSIAIRPKIKQKK